MGGEKHEREHNIGVSTGLAKASGSLVEGAERKVAVDVIPRGHGAKTSDVGANLLIGAEIRG